MKLGTNEISEVRMGSRLIPAAYFGTRPLAGMGKKYPPLANFCAVGDSLADRGTLRQAVTGWDAIARTTYGWIPQLEILSGERFKSVPPTAANEFKAGAWRDREHGYTGVSAAAYLTEITGNGTTSGVSGAKVVPITDAKASSPDIFIVQIGTNDVSEAITAEAVANRVKAVWAELVATGKPVIGADILQRSVTFNSAEIRDKIIATNAILRESWKAAGLRSYRRWDDLIVKDPETGYATEADYPDTNRAAPNQDGIHPGANACIKLANDLNGLLSEYYSASPFTVPADGNAAWLTPNPYMAGGATRSTSWALSSMGTEGSDVIYSKVTDSEGTWQRVQIVNSPLSAANYVLGIYARNSNISAHAGARCVATARIRFADGHGLAGVGISVQAWGHSGSGWHLALQNVYPNTIQPTNYPGVLEIYTDPFTLPASGGMDFLINPGRGTGTFDFQKAGIIKLA